MNNKATHIIAEILKLLAETTNKLDSLEELATEPNQWLAIEETEALVNQTEISIHEIRKLLDQQIFP
jgi:hypothetical protein